MESPLRDSIKKGRRGSWVMLSGNLCEILRSLRLHSIVFWEQSMQTRMQSPCEGMMPRSITSCWLNISPIDPENARHFCWKQQQERLRCYSAMTPKIIQLLQSLLTILRPKRTFSPWMVGERMSMPESSEILVMQLPSTRQQLLN